MIDLHTHILPAMDDGSKDVEMSLSMLRMEKEQGVDTVILTPHFYRDKERPEHYLPRRKKAYDTLLAAIAAQPDQDAFPRLILGCEVAWRPGLVDWDEIHQLCIAGTDYMLLEMPFYPWNDQTIAQIYQLMDQGITPIFAHLERYLKDQKTEYIDEILSMGTPVQVSCAPLADFWKRRPIVKMLKKGQAHLLGSDCHNLTSRPPCFGMGMAQVEKLLGSDKAKELQKNARNLLSQQESQKIL